MDVAFFDVLKKMLNFSKKKKKKTKRLKNPYSLLDH